MSFDALAGRLRVQPGAPLALALHNGRRDWAARLGQGHPASALPGLLASLFSLCSHAHRLCAQLAVAAALPGERVAPVDVPERLRRETALEHLRRMGLDWPRLLGPEEDHAAAQAMAALRSCPLLKGGVDGADPWPATLDWLQNECLGMPASTWLRAWDACGADWLLDWSERHRGWLPALVRSARMADTGPALEPAQALFVHASAAALRDLGASMAQTPGFVLRPQLHGASAHTGPWARLRGAEAGLPLTPWALLGSRLAEMVRLALPDGEAQGAGWLSHGALSTGEGKAIAWVEMARGLLVHQIEIESAPVGTDPVVRACRVLAPTEWNFHPRGPVARRVSALDPDLPDALRARQLNLLMTAFDPCVPFEVALASCAEGEVAHA